MPSPCPPHSSGSARPVQPSSAISSQSDCSKPFSLSASSRMRSDLYRAARKSWAVALIACCSSLRSKYISRRQSLTHPRQAKHALGDDVLEDVGGAALDRVGARAQEAVLSGPAGDGVLVAA